MNYSLSLRPNSLAVAVCLSALASGCAVTPMEVHERAAAKTDEIAMATSVAARQQKQEPPWLRISGNFLGSSPRTIDNTVNLPAHLRDVTFNFGPDARGTLAQVIANVRAETGLLVRVSPDVAAATIAATTGAAAATTATPLPTGLNAAQGQILPTQMSTAQAPNAGVQSRLLPLTFSGDLADYFNKITSILGISWEYVNGEVHLFRTMTRMFTLAIPPGSFAFTDDVTGGGNTSSGQKFGSNSSATANANVNPWKAADEVIKTMLSPSGKHSISESSGSIVVTDTKEVVERVEKYIQHENTMLRSQVAIDIREITVQLNDKSELGLDMNLIYRKLNASTGSADWTFQFQAPTTLTSSAAGVNTFNVVKPTAYWAGSSAAVQALNSVGRVVGDNTETIVTTNRVPGRKQAVIDQAYLASTTPATGGGTSGGVGVPGLTPGLITYGTNLTVVPMISEDNSILLQMFDTRSDLLNIASVSTGSGQTLQQINTPTLARRKYSQNFIVGQGQTLVIVGSNADSLNATTAYGFTGASSTGSRTKTISVVLVTPRILQGS